MAGMQRWNILMTGKRSERRDFTINAIYMDIDGKLFDPQMGTVDLKIKM